MPLIDYLEELPIGLDDRLIKHRLQLSNSQCATAAISAYAPTMTNSDKAKEKFYEDLLKVIQPTPRKDKLILLYHFNARVGYDIAAWPKVFGHYGVCALQTDLGLRISSSSRSTNKTTWMHPRSMHCHLLDYVITQK